jgi:uncharacterized protein (TIGR02118 family)
MIHQHIVASPKPGMSEAEFQDYWLNVHAVKFASKIPQIKRYKIDLRVDWAGQTGSPLWNGMAEIWLDNEADQLASLQTPEFLEGARLDEPHWAAFWNTQVLDTDAHTVIDTIGETAPAGAVKLFALVRRAEGLRRDDFRKRYPAEQGARAKTLPGLLRHDICTTRDGWYAIGEPRFDAAIHLWFENAAALDAAFADHRQALLPADTSLVETRYVFPLAFTEHWVIGPQPRP